MDFIEKAKAGDQEAFIELIRQNGQSLYKTARAILRNDDDAADAIQETILVCYRDLGKLRQDRYFKTWLTRILINQCYDMLSQRRNTQSLEDCEASSCDFHDDERLDLTQCIRSLPENYQLILVLYYVDGFSIREIAKIMKLNANTVKTRLSRGRERLKCLYREQEGECVHGCL